MLDNRDGLFTPGLFARMKLVSPSRYSAALVDDRAIGTDLGKRFVFVVDEQGVVQYRPVETGRLVEGLRVVENGLAAGDVVIVNGLQRVRPGVTVARDARRHGPRSSRARAARRLTKPPPRTRPSNGDEP